MNEMSNIAYINVSQLNYNMKNNSKKRIQTIFLFVTVIIGITMLLSIMIFNIKLYKIHGTSMNPTLKEKEIVLTIRTKELQRGDIIAFYHNNAIMIKRVIALSGDTIDIKTDGTVILNNKEIEEDYIKEKAMGVPDINLPYSVKQDTYFVMGDNRSDSLDSRDIAIGCVKEADVIGVVKLSIIPFGSIK